MSCWERRAADVRAQTAREIPRCAGDDNCLCLLPLGESWGDGVVDLDGDYGSYASVGIGETEGGG
jgi:hypothetical protein